MLAIGIYYIDRSHNFYPCWTIANSKKEAINKALKWSITDQCLCTISEGDKKILFTDYAGNVCKKIKDCLC